VYDERIATVRVAALEYLQRCRLGVQSDVGAVRWLWPPSLEEHVVEAVVDPDPPLNESKAKFVVMSNVLGAYETTIAAAGWRLRRMMMQHWR
jgi:hypothetical protein